MHLSLEVALTSVLRSRDSLSRAANAVPADKLLWRPGGVSAHTVHIVAHAATANETFAAVFTGGPMPYLTQVDRDSAVAACDTLEKAEYLLNRSVTSICDGIVLLSEERLAQPAIMPWGERLPFAAALLAPAMHMQYHEGQISYIQTLLGDDNYY